jgi:hypothetical protein
MKLEQLKIARANMAKNARVKKGILSKLDEILEQGAKASKEDLRWASNQAKGFARPR